MPPPTVYIETTIASYLTARPSGAFSLFTSQFVLDEAAAGDPQAAAERMKVLMTLQPLDITDEVEPLAERLLSEGALPPKASLDALHVAVATVNGVQYLLTWNCKHLANAVLWPKIDQACHNAGFTPPVICTPYELMGDPS